MTKNSYPKLLYNFDINKENLIGEKNREKREEFLIKVVKNLYTIGWKYHEVIAYFNIPQLFNAEIKRIANFIFTQDRRYNPFGYWHTFKFDIPLAALSFSKAKLNSTTLSEAGVIFGLYILDRANNNNSTKEKLTAAIKEHKNDEIIAELNNIKERNSVLLLEQPSTLRLFADIDKATLNKAIETININLKTELKIYYEQYDSGVTKTRAWITGHKKILKYFKAYCKTKKKVLNEFTQTIGDLTNGGINILEVDNEILDKNSQFYIDEYNRELTATKRSSTKLSDHYHSCFKSKGNLKLEYFFDQYESTFLNEKKTYLSQLPIKSNPALRIYKVKKKFYLACQKDFLNYKLILSTLYGDKSSLQKTFKIKTLLKEFSIDMIPDKKAASTLKAIAYYRKNFIKSEIGNHIHPISSPINPITDSRHFMQIKAIKKLIKRMSNTGIMIDLNKLKSLKNDISNEINRRKDIPKQINQPTAIPEISDFQFDFDEDEELKLDKLELKTLENYLENIKSYLGSVANMKSTSIPKLYGNFNSHGAITHRMTCRGINLQGIPKPIRKSIFATKSGYKLLSADVAGQDIVVTANIAYRIANDINLEGTVSAVCIKTIRDNIDATILKLSDKRKNPINLITDHVYEDFISKFIDPNPIDYDKIRNYVKRIVYAKFYGGGKRTVTIEVKERSLNRIATAIKEALPIIDQSDLIKRMGRFLSKIGLKEAKELQSAIKENYLQYLKNLEDGDRFVKLIDNNLYEFSKHEYLYDSVEFFIKLNLPGILDVFEILQYYMETNKYKLTYPTALGWQTPIDPLNPSKINEVITKSKSYVIQATGAEFIREWLLTLSKSEDYQRNRFTIISAIHDQIIVETPSRFETQIGNLLISSAKEAARRIGLNENTIHIPSIKTLAG